MIARSLACMAWCLACLAGASLQAQTPIGGLVNDYAAVTNVIACDSAVVVSNPAPFSIGDRVLLLQMKGAEILRTNDSTFGTPVNLHAAGAGEFLVVEAIAGSTITFSTRMVHPYDTSGVVQLVRVPTYDDARITQPLTAMAWDGTRGGVVAVWVNGTLSMEADIDVRGMGYRGGRRGGVANGCNMTDFVTGYGEQRAGGKGESAVVVPLLAARGHLLSGGGGGNGHNSGGAGGGNGGRGGHGGDASVYCRLAMNVGGDGGLSMADVIRDQRFFLGGGGGGGHENRGDFEGTSGGNGGGIVMLHARVIRGNGRSINASGADVVDTSGWDGAGGGGAGGTVLLDAESVQGTLRVNVRGGKGGDVGKSASQGKVYSAHGPGGGGAGGIVVTTRPHPAIVADLRGGTPGTHVEPNNEAYQQSRNATVGGDGVIIDDLTWRTPKVYPFAAGGGGAICPGDSVTLWATPGFLRYAWSNGATTASVRVGAAGTYSVIAIDSGGCPHEVSGIVVRYNPAQYTVQRDLDFGACDMFRDYAQTLPFVNEDDDTVVIGSVTLPNGFTLVQPTTLPARVAPGATLSMVVRFRALEDRDYGGSMYVSVVGPCPTSSEVRLTARVKPVYITFFLPDTLARIGSTDFGIPLRVRMTPDSAVFDDVTFTVDVRVDSRVFAPERVTKGTIVRNIIDVLRKERTITIRFDSVDMRPGVTELTHLVGTVLSSTVFTTPLDVPSYVWLEARQEPIVDVVRGSLTVDPTCFAQGRPIKLFTMPTLAVAPNPASDMTSITVTTTIPGPHAVDIVDLQGRTQRTVPITPTPDPVVLRIGDLSSGVYVVRFVTPVTVLHTTLVVQ